MSYIDQRTEDTWQKRLFDKLMTVESKLDHLLFLQEQSVDTTIHPPLKPEYLDIIDVSKIYNDITDIHSAIINGSVQR